MDYGIVESILASVQWDRWKFMLSAPKLVKQDVAVISHSHADHWASNLRSKNLVLIPEKVRAPCEYSNLHNAIVVDEQKIGKLRFIALGRKLLKSLLRNRESVQTTHATWWLISYRDTRVLFIGDLNFEDVLTARHFVKTFYEKNFFLHGVLLPSFGGINGHGSNELQLSSEIKSFAQEMRDIYGTILAGLPHPVNAEWAHYNAIRLDSIVK